MRAGQRVGLHFVHHVAAMNLHRVFAGPELRGDLLIEQCRQRPAPSPRARGRSASRSGVRTSAVSRRLSRNSSVPVERLLNCVEQFLRPERLRQEFNGTRFHRPNCHRDITVSGDEDDWNGHSGFGQRTLTIQTAHARKSDVENQATRAVGAFAVEKLLRRRECLRPQRHRRQKILDRSAHTRVVVDDEHDGCVFSDHLCASGVSR